MYGSNFELLISSVRSSSRGGGKTSEVPPLDTERSSFEGNIQRPFTASWRGTSFEIGVLLLIGIVVACEAASELFTDTMKLPVLTYANATVPVRAMTFKIFQNPEQNYSAQSDLLFLHRCASYEGNRTFVTPPNFIQVQGGFEKSHGIIPRFNFSTICLFDERNTSMKVEATHTKIALQKQASELARNETVTIDDIQHKMYSVKRLTTIGVPLFSKLKPLNEEPSLLLVEINGARYTCTNARNEWCVRTVGTHNDTYEVIYPRYRDGQSEYFGTKRLGTDVVPGVEGVLPIRVPTATWPLLANDRYMLRPERAGRTMEDIEDNLSIITIGCNWGWTTQDVKEQEAIVGRMEKIVPTVQVGYAVALGVILFVSVGVIILASAARRGRKINGLVGEHAFIDRWTGHLAPDDSGNHIGGRTQLVVVKAGDGVWHIQPPEQGDLRGLPMSR